MQIKLPDSADVRLLPESNELELHFLWKSNLLSVSLFTSGFTFGKVSWGLIPADTGKHNEVGEWKCKNERFFFTINDN